MLYLMQQKIRAVGTVTATDPEGDSFSFTISGNDLAITPEES